MKILFIVHRFHTNLFFPIKALLDAGHNVVMLVPDIREFKLLPEDHTLLKPDYIKGKDLTIKFIIKKLKDINPDLLIQRYFEGKWRYFSLIALLKGVKRIEYNQRPYLHKNLLKVYLSPIRRLFRCHPFYRFTPVLGIQGNKPELFTYYIPFPIEVLDLAKDRIYCPDNIIRIMFVGKFGQERKKHIFLLDVLESLNCSNIEVSFFGVSSDYHLSDKKYHSEFLRRCKVSSLKISIMESVKYKDMLESYLNHDLLICPSIREPFGISVLEALASGCPAIVSNDNGSAGYVENSVNGFVFKANNFNELRNHVEFFINNPGKIREYGVNAIEKIRKEHSLQDFAKKIVKYGCK